MSSDRWKWSERSEHWGFSTRTQTAEKVLRWYSTHVASLVKVAGWGRGAALVFASVALDENTGDDKQEDGAQCASEGNENNEANGHVATWIEISRETHYRCCKGCS